MNLQAARRSTLRSVRQRGRRGATALEFAILCIPFFIFLLGTFEVSYDIFVQSALDSGLQRAVRQIETGNAQNVTTTSDFVTRYLCPDLAGLLRCGNQLLVNVKAVTLGTNSSGKNNDFYAYTTGVLPISGNTLVLPANFGTFCNGAANQALVVTAIYLAPTFVGNLLPGMFAVSYNGSLVHAAMATRGVITEQFPATTASGSTPASPCASS